VQRNFVSKFSSLNKKDPDTYDKILNLPFITCQEKFKKKLSEILDSKEITETEKNYLEEKLKMKERWAKSFVKSRFCGGVCTTSRIEGLHGVLRRYLNSNSSLQKVFNCFRQIEAIQVQKHEQEYKRHSKQAQIIQANPLIDIQRAYPGYVYKKIAPKFSKGLNYVFENNGKIKNSW